MRRLAREEDRRADGRRRDEVRPIQARAGQLPSTPGSAEVTRGAPPPIAVATLGVLQSSAVLPPLPFTAGHAGRVTLLSLRLWSLSCCQDSWVHDLTCAVLAEQITTVPYYECFDKSEALDDS